MKFLHNNQPEEVHSEKCQIYNPTINYYKEKYGLEDISVEGILIGARGTITQRFLDVLKLFNLENTIAKEVALIAVKYTIQIIRHHLYNSN